jgi:hypothetical protein
LLPAELNTDGGDFMAVYSGSQHIVRFHSGELWCFSMDKNTGISYRRMDQSGAWAQPSVLIADAREDFSVNIDSKDHLHLICRSAKGELLYLFYSGAGWSRQILCRYEPVRYTIRYPIVIPRNNKIHILFAIGTTFDTGYWSLQHYYWDETAWHSKEIVRITAGYRLSPFYAEQSEKHLHLVYRALAASKYQIFYCRYHLEHGIWSTPENVTHSEADCNMPSILIHDNILHLVWTSLFKNDLTIKYRNKAVRNLGRVEWSQELSLNDTGSNASFPRLLWVEGKIWCVWYQTEALYGSCSEDQGASWSSPIVLTGCHDIGLQPIHYSTNHPREKQVFQLQWLLGSVEEGLFLPLVSQYLDLPEYRPNPPAAGWNDDLDDMVQYNRKKKISEENQAESTGSMKLSVDYAELMDSMSKNVRNVPAVPAAELSLENILLSEFDRQEELHYSLISKLDEYSRINSSVLEETRQVMSLLRDNFEMLQDLKKSMEEAREDIKQLKKKGFIRRILPWLYN